MPKQLLRLRVHPLQPESKNFLSFFPHLLKQNPAYHNQKYRLSTISNVLPTLRWWVFFYPATSNVNLFSILLWTKKVVTHGTVVPYVLHLSGGLVDSRPPSPFHRWKENTRYFSIQFLRMLNRSGGLFMILVAAENAKKMQVRRFFEKLCYPSRMITKDGGQLVNHRIIFGRTRVLTRRHKIQEAIEELASIGTTSNLWNRIRTLFACWVKFSTEGSEASAVWRSRELGQDSNPTNTRLESRVHNIKHGETPIRFLRKGKKSGTSFCFQ